MANKARGEVDITLAGKTYPCALSLGALAEIADALGVETFQDIMEAMGEFTPKRGLAFLTGLLRGNGHEVDAQAIRDVTIDDLQAWMTALMRATQPPEGADRPQKGGGKKTSA